jgi:hypothetical protein
MKMHKSITLERVVEAIGRRDTSLDDPGFCIACGEEASGCEPDACGYICKICDEPKVYGAEELFIRMI